MAYQFKNTSVLIVDDMAPMLSLVLSLLKIFGFGEIYTATNVESAFEKFCRHSPDIVLTDWMMAPLDGMELVSRIRHDPLSPNKYVPIIMMTGYSHKARVMKARDTGVTEFLVKPFRARDLYARVEQLIERPRKFVAAEEYFGPDRRRRKGEGQAAPKRRDTDEDAVGAATTDDIDFVEQGEVAGILRDLQQQARDAALGRNPEGKKK